MTGTVAVAYLARSREGEASFRRFAQSYSQHAAGVAHDLVIIYKAFDTAGARDAARAVFSHVPHIAIDLEDGDFDIGSYGKAAAALAHQHIVCLNTHAEVACENWLRNLITPLLSQETSLVGASASYESILDSTRVIESIGWRWRERRQTIDDPEFATRYAPFITRDKGMHKRTPVYAAWRAVRRHLFKRGVPASAFSAVARCHPKFRWLTQFPHWPNPHIRTNGFAIRRKQLASIASRSFKAKEDVLIFESGKRGFSATMAKHGELVLVDRNGRPFKADEWLASNTFRLGSQSGLNIKDNQTRGFDDMAPSLKETYYRLTWGGPHLLLEEERGRR